MKEEIVYGPVPSWRLGRSLGIDPICMGGIKICSLDCIYCSLGKTVEKTIKRKEFVDVNLIKREVEEALSKVDADVLTFVGTGEPTLAQNLGEAIEVLKKISNLPVAVITNSTLMNRHAVRMELSKADIVVASLDASDESQFKEINRPFPSLSFEKIVKGLMDFRDIFPGKLAIEVMFVRENSDSSEKIAEIVCSIAPDEVQINTPLRKSPTSPLGWEEIDDIRKSFRGLNTLFVFDAERVSISKVVGKRKLNVIKRLEDSSSH